MRNERNKQSKRNTDIWYFELYAWRNNRKILLLSFSCGSPFLLSRYANYISDFAFLVDCLRVRRSVSAEGGSAVLSFVSSLAASTHDLNITV